MISSFKNGITIPKIMLLLMAAIFFNTALQSPARADMVSTGELEAVNQVESKRDEVRSFLARDEIRNHLLDNGVDTGNVDARIAAMTDAEVMAFHSELDNLPAGEGVLGAILTILVIFMLLDMAGVTDIFPSI